MSPPPAARPTAIDQAMAELRRLLPQAGAYVAESDFFDAAWRDSFWGPNYSRLLAVKDAYDPDGLFIVASRRRQRALECRRVRPLGLTATPNPSQKSVDFSGC